ncbi:energy-coupling factor transporter transmembrane component T [Nocardioides sp. CER19]|uniref:energy-coupling factor transporter transmembrane component T n=1 Tax=Nocardioides sp. CER19 TaxID=3038538 RepID=UPI002448C5DD|nr:energy-coupling factor transporter transmembrane component T [Nocardioides sp. CER19]MDH2414102.1 energy-coupling factor transporter transmembrane component T [Nocardioides sp. CER19]
MTGRLARDLHPVAWWVWAIGLAAYASQTTNPWLLLLLVGVAALVVSARRSDQPWARSFRLYVWAGVFIVAIRVAFRVLLGSGYAGTVVLQLPEIPLPGWVLGITLLGPVTRESLLAGLYDGLRLATIVICVGAANALANPKRLLRSMPAALYEIGSAVVVAVSVLPQLAESVQRVRRAQRLRAGDGGRKGRLRRFLVPVLEDALERSLTLAAGMDTRGYGRSGSATRGERRVTGALMVVGLIGVCAGAYALLDQTFLGGSWRLGAVAISRGAVVLLLGVAVCVAGMAAAGRRVERTVYRPDPWRWPETAVALTGVAVGAVGSWVAQHQYAVANPDLSASPQISAAALLGVLVGLAPVLLAPAPRLASSRRDLQVAA